MKKFLRSFLAVLESQTLLITTIILGALGACLWIALQSEIQAFPEFTNVQVQVITQFAGKAAEEVERQVTIPVEVATNGLPGLINQRSISLFGLSVITLTFADNVESRQARIDVAQRLQDVAFPEGAVHALNPDTTPVGEIFRYTIETDQPSDAARLFQDWVIERSLKGIPGVADVVTFGGPVRSYDAMIDLSRARKFGIDVNDVIAGVERNNSNAGGSPVSRGEESYLVRSLGLYRDSTELEQAVVASPKGVPVRIGDIGFVKIGSKFRNGQVGRNSSDDVVEGMVLLRKGADTLSTCEAVRGKIQELNNKVLPQGTKIVPFYDRTDLIRRSAGTVTHNVVFGIVLVIVLLTIGIGIRYWTLILAVGLIIPLALIIALVGVRFFGLAPNLISLGAVDFGIIVETAIFAVEALIVSLSSSNRKDSEVLSATLARTLSPAFLCAFLLLIAFIPILTLQQVEGRIFRPLGITLLFALLGGQIGALIFVPFAMRWAPAGQTHRGESYFHRGVSFLEKKLSILGLQFSKFRLLFPVVLAALFVVATSLFSFLGTEFLPNLNEGAIYVRAIGPKTQSLAMAVDLAAQMRKRASTVPEALDVITQIGRPDDGTDINGFDVIEMFVVLKDPKDWVTSRHLDGIVEAFQEKMEDLEGVEFSFSQPIKDNVDEAISGVKGELVIKIFGPDLNILQSLATQARKLLSSAEGAKDVFSDDLTGLPELRFTFLRDVISRFGLNTVDVQATLETALLGKVAGTMIDDSNRFIDILVRPILPENPTYKDLEQLPLATPEGGSIPLDEATSTEIVDGVTKIFRESGQRRVAARSSVRGRPVVELVKEVDAKINSTVKVPPGYNYQWSGSFENAKRAASRLMVIVPLCFAVILVILYAWFKSWTAVGLVVMQVPFANGFARYIAPLGVNSQRANLGGGVRLGVDVSQKFLNDKLVVAYFLMPQVNIVNQNTFINAAGKLQGSRQGHVMHYAEFSYEFAPWLTVYTDLGLTHVFYRQDPLVNDRTGKNHSYLYANLAATLMPLPFLEVEFGLNDWESRDLTEDGGYFALYREEDTSYYLQARLIF